jgi:(5-formylfuran-3-yl)methyl phosphate synthase
VKNGLSILTNKIPQILISVRNVREAETALLCGCDIIDLKEPANGSLGAVSDFVGKSIVDLVQDRCSLSFALGELVDRIDPNGRIKRAQSYVTGNIQPASQSTRFVKMGLSNALSLPNWQTCWLTAMDEFPSAIQKVVVAYADGENAGAPPLETVVRFAMEIRAPVLLVDTFDKSKGTLFEYCSQRTLVQLIDQLHAVGIKIALAGSIRADLIQRYAIGVPDIWGMRGAVCDGGRSGTLSKKKINEIKNIIQKTSIEHLEAVVKG